MRPEEFAGRWVRAIQDTSSPRIRELFTLEARLVFESDGKSRQVGPLEYADLLRAARGKLTTFERRLGAVDITRSDDPAKGPLLVFEVTDRLETPEGYALESESREEFELDPQEGTRAVRYRSRALSSETLRKPQAWMNYGGPTGLNGYLIEAYSQAAPQHMWVVVAAAVVALILFGRILYSLGFTRRR